MEPFVKILVDYSPALAGGVVATILVTVTLLKALGVTAQIGDKAALVPDSRMTDLATGVDDIKEKLSTIEGRVREVEHELSNRPTREEIHRLELSFTRLEGRLESQAATIQSTANAIGRIEDYMYTAAATARAKSGVR